MNKVKFTLVKKEMKILLNQEEKRKLSKKKRSHNLFSKTLRMLVKFKKHNRFNKIQT